MLLSGVLLSGCRARMDTLSQGNPSSTFTAGAATLRQLSSKAEFWHMSQSRHKIRVRRKLCQALNTNHAWLVVPNSRRM